MLTKLTLRHFKRFEFAEIELGNPVVFIGPNNSGKTTALQALALWELGLNRWTEKHGTSTTDDRKRAGVAINRRDLIAIPLPDAKQLWRNLHVRDTRQEEGIQKTKNIRVEVLVEGVTESTAWKCGLEFDYSSKEQLHCRPVRTEEAKHPSRMAIPVEALGINVAFLPPMSGLAAAELRIDPGAIKVRIGEGRTAEVLRNLCFSICIGEDGEERWKQVADHIHTLFGVTIEAPTYLDQRGEITMSFRERSGPSLDLSCSGRGLQQTLLILAYFYSHRNSVLLLDEPDAHLEILRQRQIYQLLTDVARETGCQIVAASHSEVLLNEAARRDVVVAFLGKPRRIDDRGSQVLKSLSEIGFDQYYQAEQTGWVLYLEGATDLAILQQFAQRIGHPVSPYLDRPFVHYVQNQPSQAAHHFHGLRAAKPDLVGFGLFDRLEKELESTEMLVLTMWHRREIENYLCQPETLRAYAEDEVRRLGVGPLFEPSESARWRETMDSCIREFVPPAAIRDRFDRWWYDTKASDDFLERVFNEFFERLELPNLLRKTRFHILARHVASSGLDPEVGEVLDGILSVAKRATSDNDLEDTRPNDSTAALDRRP